MNDADPDQSLSQMTYLVALTQVIARLAKRINVDVSIFAVNLEISCQLGHFSRAGWPDLKDLRNGMPSACPPLSASLKVIDLSEPIEIQSDLDRR